MIVQDVLRGIRYEWNQCGSLAVPFTKITSDSRKISTGDLFVALRGPIQDGHRYIEEALRRGAAAIICEKGFVAAPDAKAPLIFVDNSRRVHQSILINYYDDALKRIRLIGVTGTNGKTTTAYLIQFILNQFSSCGMIGTVEYAWNQTRIKALNTTPGLEAFLELLSQMVSDGVQFCVAEISSHALDQGRVGGLQFDAAIFTNLTQDHMDYHKDFEQYYRAKSKLFLSDPKPRASFINTDDDFGRRLRSEQISSAYSFGLLESSDFRIHNVNLSLQGAEFDIINQSKNYHVKTKLPLIHNVYNMTGAIIAVNSLGFSLEQCASIVGQFPGVPGRLQAVAVGQPFNVFVDYAHTPDAFQNVFASIKPHVKGKLISVFGCGGNRDRLKRPMMGQIAAKYCDSLILTNDNPRNEDPKEILSDIKQGIQAAERDKIKEILDRREAIQLAVSEARSGDTILILGKGHEVEQIVGSQSLEFSDYQVAHDLLIKK